MELTIILLYFCVATQSWDFNAVDWELVRVNESYARQVRHEQYEASRKTSLVYKKQQQANFDWLAACSPPQHPSGGDYLGLISCDTGMADVQSFKWKEQNLILNKDPSLCVTVGKDVDPDSGTPRIELQPCSSTLSSQQNFKHDSTNQHMINVATGKCIDLDQTDMNLELYGCNNPISPNQQWSFDEQRGNIVSHAVKGSCATVCGSGSATNKLGNIAKFEASPDKHGFNITDDKGSKVQIIFYRSSIFRIWLGVNGRFINPAGDNIVVSYDIPSTLVTTSTEKDDYYAIESDSLILRAYKKPLRFELYAKDGSLVWKEDTVLSWSSSGTMQTLTRSNKEHVFGGGMQCGYFSHNDKKILIKEGGGWKDGGRPNPVPFYLSTAGYGVFRNTFSPGEYDFLSNMVLSHEETRFDAFYFYGPGLKEVLNGFTTIVGRPFLPPIWGLGLGDSDCYNKKGRQTTDVLKVADLYRSNNMPGSWILPDDGYGCGYTQLPYVIKQLHTKGFYTGLWTSTGLANATWEIGTAGSRGIKTDVAWVGSGYKFELDALKEATGLIEGNSDGRRYTWSVCGWAGSQRHAVLWNGDNSGSWEYIRFQIPTVLGSGLSAQAHTSGDVDGIFGGSPETYTRDLQWKCFLTVSMTMSGWANYDKQPFRYGEPYTTYNRKYLNLKNRMIPYQYSLSYIAYLTGTPPARAMVLEFPNDPTTWDTTTQYQFMSGPWFLVAPVYEKATTRSGIYLPAGDWIDYWDGTVYKGPKTLNNYAAPVEKLPVFVKSGAIIPMWPEMLYFDQKSHDRITFDVYPAANSSFTLYEDDGLSRNFEKGAYSQQVIQCSSSSNSLILSVGVAKGEYKGKPSARGYMFTVHTSNHPSAVSTTKSSLKEYTTVAELDKATDGWAFVSNLLSIKTDMTQQLSSKLIVTVKF